ncbi:uncharacterized protein BX664DRAFT_347253 [Halteromyces radiatus]|uniref:uncharacterized protein n=1 Tax=Halteromyces radiatus TaxID=101107 RepID=UPI00221E7D28|nr:uncharacterized protein BX664DRAFT_347253 [Halteromyces radiatus]KAI8097262.1 hypothetical protein BX664DRAFT_347253 [Halteromyces radiatus]
MLPQKRPLHPLQQDLTSFNLERVIQQYATQPDLLELILSSKVEEDRRRAEEAKLKRKEIDYILQQQQKSKHNDEPEKETDITFGTRTQKRRLPSPPSPSLSSTTSSTPPATLQPSLSSDWSPPPQQRSNHSIEWRSSSIILPPLTSSPTSSSSSSSSFSPQLGPVSLPHTDSLLKPSIYPSVKSPKRLSDTSFNANRKSLTIDHEEMSSLVSHHHHQDQTPPSPPSEKYIDSTTSSKSTGTPIKRRRREMQAITTIIETKEFPYNDDYLWRNNGNTIHKKTGNKSIYYKCANSQQGCPVNKTCTLRQDTGEYLIKYRGTHLPECSTIKRINEVQ